MRYWRPLLVLALLIVVTVLAFQNRGPVETKLLFTTVIMPHSILLLLTSAFGFVLGSLFTMRLAARRGARSY
jgi:uncharacterized integral membrane protein